MRALFALGGFALAVAAAAPASAEDTECRGTLGPVTIDGALIVPDDATCTLNGTQIRGAIRLKSRSNLYANGVSATNGLQGESPGTVRVVDSRFRNAVSLSKGETLPRRSGAEIRLTRVQVTGDIQLQENRDPITLEGNEVVGSIQAAKNTGGLVITGNRIGNALQCQDNRPPPTGGGNVARQKQGQCQAL